MAKLGKASANVLEICVAFILLDNAPIPTCDGPKTSILKRLSIKESGIAHMSTTGAAAEGRVALDTVVARLSIQRLCKIFTDESDETRRHTLVRLIAEERSKLFSLIASPALQ